MKLLKFGLRFWITVASIFSFLTGWILLANAPKPNQFSWPASSSSALLPTLEPLQPVSDFQTGTGNQFQDQPFFNVQPRNPSRPFFSTGGS